MLGRKDVQLAPIGGALVEESMGARLDRDRDRDRYVRLSP
jgi:hypothetical protein